jgi:hypothetical protein
MEWVTKDRPGMFGRRRDERIRKYDLEFGLDNWRLAWVDGGTTLEFADACRAFYEEAYFLHLSRLPGEIDFICSFGECIDNAPTNVLSGLDYTVQEAFSTHIQDIAVRNVLARLGRRFEGPAHSLLVIRTKEDNGHRFGPGNIPYHCPERIIQPSMRPWWANKDSVEDFWQSNKVLQVRREEP